MADRVIVVREGDTLWSLAGVHLGSPVLWPKLFQANAETIVAEQKRRGLKTEAPEDWIFPGTGLRVPT